MRWLLVVVVSAGCAATTGLGVGATIDGDGRVGIEGEAHGGAVGAETVTAMTENVAIAANMWIFGAQVAIGALPARFSMTYYVEYLHLGTASSRWGYHARLAVGIATDANGSMPVVLTAGPNHLASQYVRDTNDGLIPNAITQGLDLSARYMAHARCWIDACAHPPSPWQLGAFYERQWSTYAPQQ